MIISGPYKSFGGRDASRALALGSFEDDMFAPIDGPIDSLKDLSEDQHAAMLEWVSHFETKYIVVGNLLPNHAQ